MIKIEKNTFINISYYLFLLISFFIPVLKKAVPPLIILWILSNIALFSTSNYKNSKNKNLIYVLVFYLISMIISLLWTSNLHLGILRIQTELAIFLFPFVLIFVRNHKYKNTYAILKAFIWGNLVAVFFDISRAFYRIYLSENGLNLDNILSPFGQNAFTYSDFSALYHPSYAAMYVVFAIISVFYLVFKLQKSKKNLLFLIIFFPSVFLYSSKVGIFSLFVAILFIILFSVIKYKKVMIAVILLVLNFILFFFFVKNNKRINTFIHHKTINITKKDNTNTTDDRILIWQSNIELISKNIWLGTGIGDYKDEILKVYKKNNYDKAFKKGFNAHNQFLENFASLGILGFLNLVILFVLAFKIAIKERNVLAFLFLVIFTTNILFESMFSRQAGIAFFAFFFSYIFFSNYDSYKKEEAI